MNKKTLRFYSILSRWSPLKSYKGKIMLIAFIGTHVPLIALLVYFVTSTSLSTSTTVRVLLTALIATLAGAGTTLYALHHVLAPISLTSQGLRTYLNANVVPDLPTGFTDEVGRLMADTQQTITNLDQMMQYNASYDMLTAIPNRTLFRTRLEQAMVASRTADMPLAVVVVDVDGFTDFNTALGHITGDGIIKTIAQRLQSTVRQPDSIARLGNDEFAILCTNVTFIDELVNYLEAILDALAQPLLFEEREIYLTCSSGIALYPTDGESAEQLIRNAHAALKLAKQQGQNSYQFYAAAMNERLQKRLDLENDLRQALERNEFQLFYQPQMRLQDGAITGVEALLRWRHPQRGLVSPADFIPIAEATGLIVPIGEWVLREACQQIQVWQEAGVPAFVVAVNLSARQFKQPNLISMIANVLETTSVAPAWLELEITESLMMENVQQATEVLHQLQTMGIAIALDDFGTGYSSLSYLKTFPITTVKIDQSFVRDLAPQTQQSSMAQAIIMLSHSLNLRVLAEGVETIEQREYLRDHGCDSMQGYLLSRPLPSTQLVAFLTDHGVLMNVY